MGRIVVFGAGQSGRMIVKMLHGTCELMAYADNNFINLSDSLDGVKIISPKEIYSLKPDKIIISVLNKEASELIKKQLIGERINKSDIFNIYEIKDLFDVRLSTIRLLAEEIKNKNIDGCIAELGVYKGYIARELNILFKDRKLYLFDTFEGFDNRDLETENNYEKSKSKFGKFNDTSLENVKKILPYPEQVVFYKGYFPDSVNGFEEKFALVSLDADLYLPTYNGLKYFHPRLSNGGYILLHDYNSTQFPNVKKAVQDFSKETDIKIVPLCDLHGSAVII